MIDLKINVGEYTLTLKGEITINIQKTGTPPVEPPIEPPVNPPSGEFRDISEEWYKALENQTVNLIEVDGLCRVQDIFSKKIERPLKIKGRNGAKILFGVENYDHVTNPRNNGSALFILGNGAKVVIEDVDFCLVKQNKGIAPYRPSIFTSIPDHNIRWDAAVKNCDTTSLGVHGGMGLGLLYGSKEGNYIGAVNFKHAGSVFIEGKANIGGEKNGILYMVLEDVETNGDQDGELSSHKFLVNGIFTDGKFKITSEDKTSLIFNHFYNSDNSDNYAHILHAGRFTFILEDNCHLNDKEYRLRPNAIGKTKIRVHKGKVYTLGRESHAGDSFSLNGEIFDCIEKGKDENEIWTNNHKPKESDIAYHPYLIINKTIEDGYYDVIWISSFDLVGEVPTWILYKESKYGFRSYPNTQFEDWEIMSGEGQGHNFYNHKEVSIWAKNATQSGYYRQSSSEGKFLGCNMVNCKGFKDEFNPPSITSDPGIPMPDRIKNLLK